MNEFKPNIFSEKIKENIHIYWIENTLLIKPDICVVGIDPGTANMGIAIIPKSLPIVVTQIKIQRDKNPVKRMAIAQQIMSDNISIQTIHDKMIIESAGFEASRFRQVELAEIRASIALWGHRKGYDVELIAPNSIRKAVFGNGKTKAHDIWTDLPPDGAAALSCAFYYLTTL